MIDVQTERILSFDAAREAVPTIDGQRPTRQALFRWARDGLLARDGSRVKLESVRIGRRIGTSREALARFFDAIQQADANVAEQSVEIAPVFDPPERSTGQQGAASKRAKGKLDAAGI